MVASFAFYLKDGSISILNRHKLLLYQIFMFDRSVFLHFNHVFVEAFNTHLQTAKVNYFSVHLECSSVLTWTGPI